MQTKNREARRETIARIAQEGRPLTEMGAEFGTSYQTIQNDLVKMGKYDIWKRERKGYVEKKRTERENIHEEQSALRKKIIGIIKTRFEHVAKETSLAHHQAAQYVNNRKIRSETLASYENVLALLQKYHKGTAKSLEGLIENTGIGSIMTAHNILAMFELNPPGGKRPREDDQAIARKKEQIPALYALGIPLHDILEFTKTCEDFARRFKPEGFEAKERYLLSFGLFSRDKLSYTAASRIYEARDRGLAANEIAEECDLNTRVVWGAQFLREEIEPVLINAMKILHGDSEQKPYKSIIRNSSETLS